MQAFHTDQTLNVQLFTLPLSSEFEAAMANAGAWLEAHATSDGIQWEICLPRVIRMSRRIIPDQTYVALPMSRNGSALRVGTLDELTKALTFLD